MIGCGGGGGGERGGRIGRRGGDGGGGGGLGYEMGDGLLAHGKEVAELSGGLRREMVLGMELEMCMRMGRRHDY